VKSTENKKLNTIKSSHTLQKRYRSRNPHMNFGERKSHRSEMGAKGQPAIGYRATIVIPVRIRRRGGTVMASYIKGGKVNNEPNLCKKNRGWEVS